MKRSKLALAMSVHHTALQDRIRNRPDYERREDPTMETIARTITAIGDSFEEFKAATNQRIDKVETKQARPGAQTPTDPAKREEHAKPFDAEEVHVMRLGDDFERYYALKSEKARKGRDARPGDGFGPEQRMSLGEFCRGVANIRTTEAVKASLAVGTDSAGGYAVPNMLMPGILRAMAPASSLMQAGVSIADVSMQMEGKSWRTAVVDTLPTAYWRNELGAVQESEPTFRAVDATPRSLAFIVRVSRELLADAANMDIALHIAIGQAFALEIDRAGLRGSGTAPEIRGILNTPGVNVVNQGANGAAIANYAPVLSGLLAVRKNSAPMPTSCITSPDALFKLAGLADSTGQPLGMPEVVKRLHWYDTAQIPANLTVGTSNDCTEMYLGDFSGLVYLMRENFSIRMLHEKYADTGEIAFLCHARLDLCIPYPKALTVVKGSRVG